MNIEKLKEEFIGKKLLSVITLDLKDNLIIETLRKITQYEYGDGIDNAQLLLFENNKALVFVDFDSDGYRSGDWFLIHLESVLDKGATEGIKIINSIVRNIEYFENIKGIPEEYDDDNEVVLITTEEYVIKLGQRNCSNYYPSNFFSVEECKNYALGISKYDIVDFKEKKI